MKDSNVTPFPKEKNEHKDSSLVSSLSPREIVSELDRYVVGQNKAKKAVAIALRNRWRRQALKGEMKDEVLPKNILMIGPTGVGKTEISRRLSKLAEAPFVKVEARSEEHTSELQSQSTISYAVFCLKKKKYTYYKEYHKKTVTTNQTPH